MPKQKLEEYIENAEAEQQKIAEMQMEVQSAMQRANSFINNDPETQADQLMAAEEETNIEATE